MTSEYLATVHSEIDLIRTSNGFRLRFDISNEESGLQFELPVTDADAETFLAIAKEQEFSL
jgi:hypothetical protein